MDSKQETIRRSIGKTFTISKQYRDDESFDIEALKKRIDILEKKISENIFLNAKKPGKDKEMIALLSGDIVAFNNMYSPLTLVAANWVANVQNVLVPNLMSDSEIVVGPYPTYTDKDNWLAADVLATATGAGYVRFECVNTPLVDIDVIVLVTKR